MTSSTTISRANRTAQSFGAPTTDEDVADGEHEALRVRVVYADGMAVVSASGRLVRHTARRLATALDTLSLSCDGMIVVDLGEVSLLDTVGLGICMNSAHAARSEGCNVVVLPPAGRSDHAPAAA